jgi:anti-sigma regulatory factor (Ser/Thr protein kinase)
MPGRWITAEGMRKAARRGKRVAGDLPTGRRLGGPACAPGRPLEDPVALFRRAVNAELAWGGERESGCGPDCVTGCEGTGQSAMFQAAPGQVRAVRDFVRLALTGHPAAEDAVAVASELAANTVAHSGSGHVGGMFTVHVDAIGQAAGLTITELRGAGSPQVQNAGADAAAGRGLAIVQELTSLFWVSDGAEIRILFATIPAPPG